MLGYFSPHSTIVQTNAISIAYDYIIMNIISCYNCDKHKELTLDIFYSSCCDHTSRNNTRERRIYLYISPLPLESRHFKMTTR